MTKKPLKRLNNIRMKKNNNLPTALYIHIPFCESICDYCDFTKLQYFHSFGEKYLTALNKELIEIDNENLVISKEGKIWSFFKY